MGLWRVRVWRGALLLRVFSQAGDYMLIGYWGESPALEDDAKGVLSLLWACYPNHPWVVKCFPGLIHIQHSDFPPSWGMALKVREADHDAAVMKKKITMLAGEWLERAQLKRGAGEAEQQIVSVEGLPIKYQNMQERHSMPESAGFEYRSAPRPQAVKQ